MRLYDGKRQWRDLADPVKRRALFGEALITLFLVALLLVALVVLLWMVGWWPERLIPWIPVDRL